MQVETVGVSGTRFGGTDAQLVTLRQILTELKPSQVVHGRCVGIDTEFAAICHKLVPRPWILARPGRSAKGGENELESDEPFSNEILPAETHFKRNRLLVDESDVFLIVPFQTEVQDRGGTWYSYGYALKKGKPVIVIWPDGTTTSFNWRNPMDSVNERSE